jgi:hypothetical protein
MIPFKAEFSVNSTIFDINEEFSKLKIFHDIIITCIKGMIVLATCNLVSYNINEFFIGDLNRYLVKIEKNTAFAWKNISNDISITITNIDHITLQFDPHDENKQESSIGFTIPYKFY